MSEIPIKIQCSYLFQKMILLEFSLNPFMFKIDQLFQYITRSTPLEFKKHIYLTSESKNEK